MVNWSSSVTACVDGKPFLLAENPSYAPIALSEDHELVIWGVVVHCIHTL